MGKSGLQDFPLLLLFFCSHEYVTTYVQTKKYNTVCCQLHFLEGWLRKEATLTVQDPLAGRSLGEVSHELFGALRHPQLALAVAVSWRRRGGHGRGAAAQALQGMSVREEEGWWLDRSNMEVIISCVLQTRRKQVIIQKNRNSATLQI